MNRSRIKICGIKNIATINCCIKNRVSFFGLIFYNKSPRNISLDNAKILLNYSKNKKILSVGVFVNKKIEILNTILKDLKFDFIQLHGIENNNYIKYIKKNNKVKIIKVISTNSIKDLQKVSKYPDADVFLFDYKPNNNELPGGNAKSFKWSLIKNINLKKPWFLSGGININNIKEINNFAIPYGIDISSGVEVKPGFKSNKKITDLINLYNAK